MFIDYALSSLYFHLVEKGNDVKERKKSEAELADTLSRRVNKLREMRNMTVLDLAKSCRFTVSRIEAIESGLEIWLSFTDRTILARALGVMPAFLKEVESSPAELPEGEEYKQASEELENLAELVLAGKENLSCPKCMAILKTGIESALDFEGNPTRFARAYCPVCPFVLR